MKAKKKLIDIIAGKPQPELETVVLNEDFYILAQSANEKLLNYLSGKLNEILDLILTNKGDDDKDESVEANKGTKFSDTRKIAHNLCTVLSNKDVKEKIFNDTKSKNVYLSKLKAYVNENSNDSTVNSRFSYLVRNIISVNKDLISENPWLLSPLLAFPDRVGYSTLLFTVLRINPQFYKFAAMRSSDFMRKADEDHKNFDKCSFILLNIFSLLIKSNDFKIESFNVEIMKDILDATLLGREKYKLAFYEGIFVTSSIIKKVDPKSAISRYVKARGKAFYNKLGLEEIKNKIKPGMDIKKVPNLPDIIAAFPAFYKSGFKNLYPLMFSLNNVVSSDFGRTCLDYIVSMPEMKFNRFIDDNNIKNLIMKNTPKLPNDGDVLDSEENIQYFNPHVILLAFYIVEGLPKNRGSVDNTISPNPYSPETTRTDDFLVFVVEHILPFRQLVLPDLTKFYQTEAKLNAE